jgi:hypothetical protein
MGSPTAKFCSVRLQLMIHVIVRNLIWDLDLKKNQRIGGEIAGLRLYPHIGGVCRALCQARACP